MTKRTSLYKFSYIILILYVASALLFVTDGVTIRYHIVDFLFLSFFFLTVIASEDWFWPRNNVYANSILLFSLYLLFSFFWSPNNTFAINLVLQGSLILNSVALFYLTNKHNAVRALFYGFLIHSTLNNLIYLDLIPNSIFSSQDPYLYGRFIGTAINPNLLAIDLFFGTFAILFLLKYESNKYIRLFYNLNLVLVFNTILGTGSKKGLISFLLLILFHLYFKTSKSVERRVIFVFIGLMGLILTFTLFGDFIISNFEFTERFVGMFDALFKGEGDESSNQRLTFIEIGLEGFSENPIFGHGQDAFSFYNYFYSHNNYVELLFNLGLIGFVIYYSMLTKLILRNNKSVDLFKHNYLILLIILLMDTALVSFNLRSHMIIFTILSIIINRRAIYENSYNK